MTAAGEDAPPPSESPPPEQQELDPRAPIPERCQNFPLAGLRHSPGGSVLPSKCSAFHPTWNNPYAIRCVDAIPAFDSGFPGDELCILPPPPDRGIQIGFHPQGGADAYWEQIWNGDLSGYDDPGSEWVLEPGSERTESHRSRARNPTSRRYYRVYFRMRVGAHHGIYTLHERSEKPEGWDPAYGDIGVFVGELATIIQNLGGQQRLDDNVPLTLEPPPEDADLYFNWPARPEIMINVHSFNPGDEPLLREGWTNLWWEPEGQTRVEWYTGIDPVQVVALEIQPGQVADYHYVFEAVNPARLLSILGHRHAWTSEFIAWIERAQGGTELIYRSLDWSDMPTYRFDSVTQNPDLAQPDADGAASGILELQVGDELHFNCHVEYTDERAVEIDWPQRPSEIGPLYFDNNAVRGEMCALFGAVTGEPFFLPVFDESGVPRLGPQAP